VDCEDRLSTKPNFYEADQLDTQYYLKEAFPLLDLLKTIVASDPDIKDQIMQIRKEVTGLNYPVTETETYYEAERARRKEAMMAARQEFEPPQGEVKT
jgi:hypothetical protein